MSTYKHTTQNATKQRDIHAVQQFAQHRRILHGSGSLPGVYYFNYGGRWDAKQVTPVGVDAYPHDQRDAYYNVYPQSVAPASGKRGEKTNVTGSGGFYCEFDGQDFLTDAEIASCYIAPVLPDGTPDRLLRDAESTAHTEAKKRALTQSPAFFAEVLRRITDHIAGLEIQPSAIMASGGGYHCFWYFTEPVRFDGDDDRQRFEAALAAWVAFNGGDGGAKDTNRVLRVAGTVNAKKHYVKMAGAPLPVTWVAFDAGRRFSYSELCAAMPATWDAPITERKERARRTFAGGAPTPHNAGDLPDTPAVRRFNRDHRITDELRRAGCTWLHSNRWLSPQQSSNQSSLTADPATNTAYAFSSHNPVGREGVIRCADIALQLDYGGDVDAFMASISSDLPDFEHLKRVAQFGDIERLVRQRLAELAGIAQDKAAAAFAAYEADPTDSTERAAVTLQAQADAALAAVTAPSWNEAAIRKFAVGMIDLFAQSASDTVRAGWLRLAAHVNASDKTVRRYAEVCEGWLFSVERSNGHANLYRLNTRVLSKVPVSTRVGNSDDLTLVETGTLPTPGDLYAHDAFCAALNPLADTPENRRKVGETADAIRYGRNVKTMPVIPDGDVICTEGRHDAMPDQSWRAMLAKGYLAQSERRFWADLPSLGARGWLALVHLHAAGGTMAQSDLAAALGIKANRMSELLRRLIELEIVTKPDHYTVALGDWAQQLDSIAHRMPTFGSRARRESRYLQQSIQREEERMAEAFATANADPESVPAMEKRIEAIDRSITRRQARQAELLAIAEATLTEVREGGRRHPLIADLQRQIGTNEAREKARHGMRLLNAGKRDYAEKTKITSLAKRASWLLRTLEPGQALQVLLQEGQKERIATGALRYAQGRAL